MSMTDSEIREAYALGMNPRQIAERANLSHQGVRNRLAAMGVELRTHTQTVELLRRLRLAEYGSAIRKTFLRTLDVEQTAKSLGVPIAEVKAHLSDPDVLQDYKVLAGRPRVKAPHYSGLLHG